MVMNFIERVKRLVEPHIVIDYSRSRLLYHSRVVSGYKINGFFANFLSQKYPKGKKCSVIDSVLQIPLAKFTPEINSVR